MTFDLATLNNGFIDSVLTLQLEVDLRDQTDVHIATCQRRGYCNKSAVSTHKFDNPDAIFSGLRFNISRVDERYGCLACCVKAKGPVNEWNIVIDGFWDAANAYLDILLS